MRPPHTLASKLVVTGAVFLLIALGSIGLTLWVTWQIEGGAAAVNEAGRMRMTSYRIALEAASGGSPARRQAQAIDDTLQLLEGGDASRPLFVPWHAASRQHFGAVRAHWPALRERWLAGTPVPAAEVDDFVARIDAFVAAIEQRLSHWTAVLRAVQFAMVALAITSAALLLYASHLLVLDPLRRIGQGLASISAGDFSARLQVENSVEFRELSAGFNAMAERLAALYRDLERKVEEKTARLEVKSQRLAALYEVSAFVARADTLDQLARGFAGQVRRIVRADAVAIRWCDEDNERYLLLAHEGLPPALASHSQCLPSGGCHCGQAAANARTRMVDVKAPSCGWGHCSRAGFQTLLTVPVRLHQRVLGEIDIFFRVPRAIEGEELSLIETLAGHLAGGIEGLRATAAAKEAAVAGERTLIAQELHDSIAQSLAFLKIQVGLLRDALKRDDHLATQHTLTEIDAGVRESYGDVRELLLHFRTRTSAEDIEPALRSTLQKFEHQTGLATRLEMQGHGVPLPADVQVQVLHVLQEALSNVRKHARAGRVRLTVQQAPEWRFEVVDDGCGFDSGSEPGASHVGLRIMRERAAAIGARVQVTSAIGAGTTVSLTVPVQEKKVNDELSDTTAGR
jgi:two-component system nitrate/nitrite sensor histidine kinase NarX